MEFRELFKPTLLIVQLFPQARTTPGKTVAAIELAIRSGYEAVEHGEVSEAQERSRIAGLVHEHELDLTYWLSMSQYELRASISAVDESERVEAMRHLLAQIPCAAECGAKFIGILSGLDVGVARRDHAKQQLKKSILEFRDACDREGIEGIVLENSDREAHKKHLLGPTPETIELIEAINRDGGALSLCFDTAHIRLLGESWADSLRAARPLVTHIHLANCVFDCRHAGFGDHHMPFGKPGFLTQDFLIEFFANYSVQEDVLGHSRPGLGAEVAGTALMPGSMIEQQTREMIHDAWSSAMAGVR